MKETDREPYVEHDWILMAAGLAWLHGGPSMWLCHFGMD